MSHWFLSRNSNTFMRKCNKKIVNHPYFPTKLRVKVLAANPQYSLIRVIFVNMSHVVYKVVCNLLTKLRLKRFLKEKKNLIIPECWYSDRDGNFITPFVSVQQVFFFIYFENICLRRKCMCLLYHVRKGKIRFCSIATFPLRNTDGWWKTEVD